MNFSERQIIYRDLDGITAIYVIRSGVMSFTCVPNEMKAMVSETKLYKEYNEKYPYFEIEPMVQIARMGDSPRRDFSSGATMYDCETAFALRVYEQQVIEDESKLQIVTYLKTKDGLHARHILTQKKGYKTAELRMEIENNGEDSVLDLASSFAISALTPFMEENDPEHLILHCLHSNWSGEGRKESIPVCNYNFEDSWSSLGVRVKRIGALGSMPARGYIPFIALEDEINGATWAVQLEAPDSWQIEAVHRYGAITLFGGHADYLYGHWRKKLKKGETFATRTAYFTVVQGDLTKACAALTRYHDTLYRLPKSEEQLPIIYNEYLYSWGNPTMENVRLQMNKARELGAEYFVIDAGWFCEHCDTLLGDWEISLKRFPKLLKQFSKEIKDLGFKAGGAWYEFESVTSNSNVSKNEDWLLKSDGIVINHCGRMFLDFRNLKVTEFLTRQVIDLLNENRLKYIKIDYNENIGFAVDGGDSPGEGLRAHVEQVVQFFKKIRENVPEIVMEVCSSGGMRHDVLFSTLGSMVSFSDAHENADGAIVAVDLHRIMQPRCMQIWASILPKYNMDEIYFTMVKAMLGRVCISGHVESVSQEMFDIVKEGVNYYNGIKDIIKSGETILIDTDEIKSLRHPKGVIRLIRQSADGKRALYYMFAYNSQNREVSCRLDGYSAVSCYGSCELIKHEKGYKLPVGGKNLAASLVLFEKDN